MVVLFHISKAVVLCVVGVPCLSHHLPALPPGAGMWEAPGTPPLLSKTTGRAQVSLLETKEAVQHCRKWIEVSNPSKWYTINVEG